MQVLFYVLNQQDEPGFQVPAHFNFACQIIADLFSRGRRVFVFTDNQEDAHQIDELLWGFDPERFIPHNLAGEGPKQGAPIEISWLPPTNRRMTLINLSTNTPGFINQFNEIIDFVPADDTLKQQARARYVNYRQKGCQLSTTQV